MSEDRKTQVLDLARLIIELEVEEARIAERRRELEAQLSALVDYHEAAQANLWQKQLQHKVSARKYAAHFVSQRGPVSQEGLVLALVKHGIKESTAIQTVYDLVSSKTGWLERTEKGLVLTVVGEEALS